MSNSARTIHKNEEIESGTALISKKIPVMLVPFFEGSDYTLEQTSNKIALIKWKIILYDQSHKPK